MLLFQYQYAHSFSRSTTKFLLSQTRRYLNNPVHTNSKIEPKAFIPYLISLEGNIGAGKTTLLEKLKQKHPTWIAIEEPVDTWCKIRNENDESILELFYRDKRRWAYTFQSCVLLTRYHNIETAIKDAKAKSRKSPSEKNVHVFLTERCMDSDYHVFAKMLREEGSMDYMELQIYERLLEQLRSTATPLSAIIHINNPTAICQERIKMRKRSGESLITSAYLNSLELHQRSWMESAKIPILSTNGNNIEDVEAFIMHEIGKLDTACQLNHQKFC